MVSSNGRKTRSTNSRKPQPPRHGVIKVSTMKISHAKAVRPKFGTRGDGLRFAGRDGSRRRGRRDYQTTPVNDRPDSDFMDASGY
jgi:hypothetical protein